MDKWRIKKGDMVQVLTGDDKGVKGEILSVLRKDRKVVVKGVNVCTRHIKPSQTHTGGIIKKEMPIHASNVMLIDSSDEKPARIGVKVEDGKKVRFSKRTNTVID